jgi:hypothetical protein
MKLITGFFFVFFLIFTFLYIYSSYNQNTGPVAFITQFTDLLYLYKDKFSLMIRKLLVTDDTYNILLEV